MKVGILRFQGDVREHGHYFKKAGAEVEILNSTDRLGDVDALVIPGGESTTIGKFIFSEGWDTAIKEFASSGKGIFATCAGLILLSKNVVGNKVSGLGLLDVQVERNAYGRQRESFEEDVVLSFDREKPFRAVFIRAPKILGAGSDVEVLAELKGNPVLVRERNILAATFHPELTDDLRIAEFFIKMVKGDR
jgi:5'-phosphate synthase pdxT subunit